MNLVDLKTQMEENKEYHISSIVFKLTTQDFKDGSISYNEILRRTQISFFQGLNELQDDFNNFEHPSYLLYYHVSKIKMDDSNYEQLWECKKHLNNVPRDLPHLESMKLMRVRISIKY